jgi:hypothetical protein
MAVDILILSINARFNKVKIASRMKRGPMLALKVDT